MRQPLHPDEKPRRRWGAISHWDGPFVDDGVDAAPTAKIEIADTEITSEREFESVFQAIAVFTVQKRRCDVIKDGGH